MKTMLVYISIALTSVGFGIIAIMLVIRDKRNYSRLTGPYAPVPAAKVIMSRIGVILVCLGILILIIIQR